MTQTAIKRTPARRGRPPSVEPAQLANVALRLFERRGFDAVTMKEVATAAGVSERTLFRLFPTKSDLVWDGLEGIRDVVVARAAALRGSGASPAELMLAIAEPFLRPMEHPAVARLSRRRLRLIAEVPALLDHPTLREIEAVLASLFTPGLELPSLVARSLVAMSFAALSWWAEQGTTVTALEAMSAAVRGLAPPQAAPGRGKPRSPGKAAGRASARRPRRAARE